jgi:hypothetical protein
VKQGNYNTLKFGDRYIMQKGVKVTAIALDQAVEEDKIRKKIVERKPKNIAELR